MNFQTSPQLIGSPLASRRSLQFNSYFSSSSRSNSEEYQYSSSILIRWVVEGEECYLLSGKKYRVKSGQFLLIKPFQSFQFLSQAPDQKSGFHFFIDPSLLNSLCKNISEGESELLEKIYSDRENELGQFLRSKLELLEESEQGTGLAWSSFFKSLTEQLLVSQKKVHQELHNIGNARKGTREDIYRRVSRVRNFINEHYLNPISLEELAGQAFLSKFHFLRCFKEVYGISPYQYVIKKRLEHGQGLLRESNRTLSEIAYLTGFIDRRAFNRAFRKSFGNSPSEYRIAQNFLQEEPKHSQAQAG